MRTLNRLIPCSVLVFVLFTTVLAQESRLATAPPPDSVLSGPAVTVTASAKRVRFVSPGTVVQLRLEVYNEAGQKLFDTELRGGNVLDWHLQDGAGERLPTGSYACVLTIKSLSGRLSQRVGLVTVNDNRAAIEAGANQLSTAQQQTIGPVAGNAAFAVLRKTEAEAITAVTHNGTEGQLTATTGALTFRTGDIFSGNDVERVRITSEGNVGIGTEKPQAKLEVAGDIRSTGLLRLDQGIEFADGTLQTTGLSGKKDSDGNVIPNATGTGTQNRIAKWTDNAGTLGDSVIRETAGGNIGIGTATPDSLINIQGVVPSLLGHMAVVRTTGANNGFGLLLDATGPGNNAVGLAVNGAQKGAFSWDNARQFIGFVNYLYSPNDFALRVNGNGSLTYHDGASSAERFRITAGGNVGVGTTTPTNKLDVAGDINTSTQYNIGGIRALTIYGSELGGNPSLINSNTFVGVDTGLNTVNTQSGGRANSFFGKAAGFNNTTGTRNSFFGFFSGYSNDTGTDNSFFGPNAGRGNTFGHSNSFFGNEAGLGNDSGQRNSFFGYRAGESNSFGSGNVFSGADAGRSNTQGGGNTFIGTASGASNTVEGGNTFIGLVANGAAGITNATAIGARAEVTRSNSLVLGSIIDTNGATADTNVGIGITAPTYKLHILDASNIGIRVETGLAGGRVASFAANGDFQVDAPNIPGGRFAVMEGGNVGINTPTPNAKLQVVGGDVAITTQFKGLILRANNGANCFRLLVNNTGALGTESVPCP